MSAASDALVGATVTDRYEILSRVGIGGWSVVYKAFDTVLNRTVAIKALHPHLCVDQDKLMRFQREAESASKIVHPNIAVIYDCGELMPGRPFICMEFVDGNSLAELLNAKSQLTTDECVSIFEQTCNGVDSIHKMGLVHRDLKPSNIKLTKTGQVKILDFGLAKWILQEQEGLTRSDEALGTPTYMSPEQCLGQPVDTRSDIYSLGCILYEAITGIKPFAADNGLKCMQLHVQVLPPRFRAVCPSLKYSATLEQVVFKAIAKNPQERFASVEKLRDAIKGGEHENEFIEKLRSYFFWRLVDLRRKPQQLVMAVLSSIFFINSRREKITTIGASPSERTRQLLFPETNVGNIYLLDRSSTIAPYERGKKYPGVSGALSVPVDSIVELADIPLTEAKSLQILSELQPADLAAITLTNRELTDASVDALNRLTGLQTLNLEGTNLSDVMLSKFNLPNLTNLNLKGTQITDDGLGCLADCFPKLSKISFRDTRITDSGLATFLVKIQPTMLDLSETEITDKTLVTLGAQPRLMELKMTATKITNDGIADVAKLKTLETLGVCQTSIDDGAVTALCKMEHLTYLNINHTEISDDALLKIRQALPTCEIYK